MNDGQLFISCFLFGQLVFGAGYLAGRRSMRCSCAETVRGMTGDTGGVPAAGGGAFRETRRRSARVSGWN